MIQKVLRLVLLVFCVTSFQNASAQTTVTGTITDGDLDMPLPAVSIVVKGTSNGTASDFDGNYSITIPNESAVLVFKYIGYTTQEIPYTGSNIINVKLKPSTEQLDEVVVTALGIKREKKAITYSAQNVSVDELSEARSLNVANSLSGKVAGLNFSTTSNGVGSSSRITLRGNRSLNGNNQPLYVVDGVPISNGTTDGNSNIDTGGTTQPDGISNINPEDIASMTVLKGPSAAALYGTRASNGVIIITTKSGAGATGTKVSISSNFMASSAINLLDLQNEYGQGSNGVYNPTSESSWGGKLDGSEVSAWQLVLNPDYAGPATTSYSAQPNNITDFYQTGYNIANTLSVTSGTEKTQAYFSYTNTLAEGIVGGNKMNRNNVNLRITSKFNDKFTLDTKANYITQNIDNLMRTGEESIGTSLYLLPRSISHSSYSDFEYLDAQGNRRVNYFKDEIQAGGNPYWSALRDNSRDDDRTRFIGFANLKYQFNEALSFHFRTGLDQMTNTTISQKYATNRFNNDLGSYSEYYQTVSELNSDVLVTYNKKIGDFSVNLNAGANMLKQRNSSLSSSGTLGIRNRFFLSNIQTQIPTSSLSEKQVNSVYGFTQIGYKNYLFLDATARNDWSSALPANNRSFFYPSIGLSGVISEMVQMPEYLTYLKVRASYAQVGNDTNPYQTSNRLNYIGGNNGMLYSLTTDGNPNLKPEISSSTEFGADIRFFHNRLGLDVTYFDSQTKNQIFETNTVPSSGRAKAVVNGGNIQNRGLEVVVNATPIETKDFSWDISANYASYKSKIISITDNQEELILGSGRLLANKIIKGGEYGDLYIKGFKRNKNGDILINANGLPIVQDKYETLAGNFNPDWTGGLKNNFRYKDFNLSFLIDMRIGGEVISYTQARQAGMGVSSMTLAGRENGLVVDGVIDNGNGTYTPNTQTVTAEQYWTSIGQREAVAEPFVYDATNIRLREVVLGYSMPKTILKKTPFTNVNISFVARNLFFIVNKAKYFDPEQGSGTGNLQGVESFNLPSTRDYGVSLKFGF